MHFKKETAVLSGVDVVRFNKNTREEPNGCVRWTGRINWDGYGRFVFERERKSNVRKQATKQAHHVAFRLANGRWPSRRRILLHSCDNHWCVNPEHIREGTHAENSAEMVAKDRQARGERQHKAKLSERDVLRIRKDASAGTPHAKLAKRYGVAVSNISMVVTRITWKHLP